MPDHLFSLFNLFIRKGCTQLLLCVGVVAFCAGSALGNTAVPTAADPALEARVMAIAEELRCLVCQNETIAASHADLAVDLRQQIREQLQQGQSQVQILDFMAKRYGDFVLYRPPLKPTTVLLWVGPFVLLLVGAWALVRRIRRQRPGEAPALSSAEMARAQKMLQGSGDS